MTWLERLSNGVKLKLGAVIAVLASLGLFTVIIVSGFLNYKQGTPPISDAILNSIIQFVSTVVGGILGYLFRDNEKNKNEKSN